jgi:altronate dehydratase small subunit
MKIALLLEQKDNVAVVLDDVQKDEIVRVKGYGTSKELSILDNISLAHKIAVNPIKKGEPVIKYGEVIGLATTNIEIGSHVHIHNIRSTRIGGD